MSVNSLMHPRNIYKVPPDYTMLAIKYSDFRSAAKLGLDGKVYLDWKNNRAVRELTKAILQNDFNLKVHIPNDNLVPTVPLRLNYILFLEDIITALGLKDVCGIDIGCGATCVYPMLAARKNNWYMYGIEKSKESVKIAQENVKQNNLLHLIRVFAQKNDNVIFEDFFKSVTKDNFTFSLCNPPFFSSDSIVETGGNNRSGHRKPPKCSKTGNVYELECKGGEFSFLKRMVEESFHFSTKISIFTTMVGHKNTVTKMKDLFDELNIYNFFQSKFCQGNTTRWSFAWSFNDQYSLQNLNF